MSIFKTPEMISSLIGDKLDNYIRNSLNILDERETGSRQTTLAIAVVQGFPEEVEQLLNKGTKADGLSQKGEIPPPRRLKNHE